MDAETRTAALETPSAPLRAGYEKLALEAQRLREELERRRLDETCFRRFFDLPLIGMAITSPQRHFLEVNDKLCQILGYSREELIGRDWATITHPDDIAGNLNLMDRALRGENDTYSVDKRYVRPDGDLVYANLSVYCVRGPDGAADHFVLTLAPQERAMQLARANAALTRTLDSLASKSSVDSALGEALTAMTEQLGSPSATMWFYDLKAGSFRLHLLYKDRRVIPGAESDHPHAGVEISLQEQTLQAGLLDGQTVVVEVRPENGFEPRICDHLRAQGVHSMLCVPMTAAGEVVGCCLVRLTGGPLQPEQIEFARVLAQQATLALLLTRVTEVHQQAAVLAERERAARERAAELAKVNAILHEALELLTSEPVVDRFFAFVLQKVGEQLEAHSCSLILPDDRHRRVYYHLGYQNGRIYDARALASSPVSIALASDENADRLWATFINPHTHYVTDVDAEEAASVYPESLLAALRSMGVRASITTPLRLGERVLGRLIVRFHTPRETEPAEVELLQSVANQMAVALHTARLAEHGRQSAVLAERERAAHERAAELAKINSILHQALQLLTSEPVVDRFLAFVLQKVVELFGAHSSSLVMPDEKRRRPYFHLTFQSGRIYDAAEFAASPMSLAVSSDEDADRRWEKFVDPRTQFVADVNAPGAITILPQSLRTALQALGVRAFTTTPLRLGDRVLGRLSVRFHSPRVPEPAEVELLQSVANQMAVALHTARLAEQGRQSAVLAERNRFARDIHDTLAQGFTGVIVQLEAAKRSITGGRKTDTNDHIQHALDLARQSLAEARRSVHALRPLALEAAGLCPALSRLIAKMTSGTGVQGRLTVSGTVDTLPAEWEENLLRIGQEALTNALRHARPSRFKAALAFGTDEITLICADDGNGFDPEGAMSGMGLTGMRDRAARLGWKLDVQSGIGRGTDIVVRLPRPGTQHSTQPDSAPNGCPPQ